jgi:Glycosyl hydrolase family 26
MLSKKIRPILRSSGLALILAAQAAAVEPVNPNATKEARQLLAYFYEIYGKKILAGQQECGYCSNPAQENQYLLSNTGKYPAILGQDMGDRNSGAIDRAIAWWKAGGISMFSWHIGYPTQADGYDGSKYKVGAADIEKVLASGSTENKAFTKRLDEVAVKLKQLQDANVPIIWRPFHEAAGNWFWWSMGGGAEFVKLWKFEFDYYTKTKGLNNLVWMLPYCGSPLASFNPGKQWIDLAGADTYAPNHNTQKQLYDTTARIMGTQIPIALHENGPIPDPAQLQSAGAKWLMFNTWNTTWLTDESNNSKSFLKTVYTSDYVITRDELPNWKTFVGLAPAPAMGNRSAREIAVRNLPGELSVFSPMEATRRITLYDMRGSALLSVQVSGIGKEWHGVRTPASLHGMFLVQVQGEGGSLERKILIP